MYDWMLGAYLEQCDRQGVKPSFTGANAFKNGNLLALEFLGKCEMYSWRRTPAQYRSFVKTHHLRGKWEGRSA